MNKIAIILADDHSLFRMGMEITLQSIAAVGKVSHAKNGVELISMFQENNADLIFMDIRMPKMNGIEAIRHIRKTNTEIKIIVLSMLDDRANIIRAMQSGANGYLLKNCSRSDLTEAIETVIKGGVYYSPEAYEKIGGYSKHKSGLIGSRENQHNWDGVETPLSDREVQVLKLICQEYTNQEMADILFLTTKSIEGLKTGLYQKSGCKNIAGLVRFAIDKGYVI
ncbi:MAG TPA: response regulator transcription factor [Bacteroidia bacterium]|nr:response regulator transcription factor [Bacteroidia bacterium]